MASPELASAKQELRSLLLSSPRGLSAAQIAEDWELILYKPCPYRQLGFGSVEQFLQAVPDVAGRNGSVYTAVADATTAHIKEMVDKQKKGKNNARSKGRRPAAPVRSYAPKPKSSYSGYGRPSGARATPRVTAPAMRTTTTGIPYVIKEAMKKLLNMFPSGLSVNRVTSEFSQRVSKNGPLVVKRMGYDSVEDFLRAMPTIVEVQGRAQGLMVFPKGKASNAASSAGSSKFGQPVDNRPASSRAESNASSSGWMTVGRSGKATPTVYVSSSSDEDDDELSCWDDFELALYGDDKGKTQTPSSQQSTSSKTSSSPYPNNSTPATLGQSTRHISTTSHSSSMTTTTSNSSSSSRTTTSTTSSTSSSRPVSSASVVVTNGGGHSTPSPANKDRVPFNVRLELYQVLAKRPQGMFSARLPHEYKSLFGKELRYSAYDFSSVVEMVDSLKDVCQITRPGGACGDWLLLPVPHPPKEFVVDREEILKTMKKTIRDILYNNPQGVPVDDLPRKYREFCGQELSLGLLGLDIKTVLSRLPFVEMQLSPAGRAYACLRQSAVSPSGGTSGGGNAVAERFAAPPKPTFPFPSMPSASNNGNRAASSPSSSRATSSRPSHQRPVSSAASIASNGSSDSRASRCSAIATSDLPTEGDSFDVYVSHIVSPSLFYIQRMEDCDELEALNHKLESVYSDELAQKVLQATMQNANPGMVCCSRYDGVWYRGVVKEIISPSQIKVFYVDYGNTETVSFSDLCILRVEFRLLPAQALRCKLAFVDPIEDEWSQDAISMMKEMASDETPLNVTVASEQDGTLSVFLIDTSTEEDVNIGNALTENGLAFFDSEAFHTSGPAQLAEEDNAAFEEDSVAGNAGDDTDDLEKLICEEVEDMSQEGDQPSLSVENGNSGTAGGEGDDTEDDDSRLMTTIVDTLNVRRRHLLDSLKSNVSLDVVEEIKTLESVIDITMKRHEAYKKKRGTAGASAAVTAGSTSTAASAQPQQGPTDIAPAVSGLPSASSPSGAMNGFPAAAQPVATGSFVSGSMPSTAVTALPPPVQTATATANANAGTSGVAESAAAITTASSPVAPVRPGSSSTVGNTTSSTLAVTAVGTVSNISASTALTRPTSLVAQPAAVGRGAMSAEISPSPGSAPLGRGSSPMGRGSTPLGRGRIIGRGTRALVTLTDIARQESQVGGMQQQTATQPWPADPNRSNAPSASVATTTVAAPPGMPALDSASVSSATPAVPEVEDEQSTDSGASNANILKSSAKPFHPPLRDQVTLQGQQRERQRAAAAVAVAAAVAAANSTSPAARSLRGGGGATAPASASSTATKSTPTLSGRNPGNMSITNTYTSWSTSTEPALKSDDMPLSPLSTPDLTPGSTPRTFSPAATAVSSHRPPPPGLAPLPNGPALRASNATPISMASGVGAGAVVPSHGSVMVNGAVLPGPGHPPPSVSGIAAPPGLQVASNPGHVAPRPSPVPIHPPHLPLLPPPPQQQRQFIGHPPTMSRTVPYQPLPPPGMPGRVTGHADSRVPTGNPGYGHQMQYGAPSIMPGMPGMPGMTGMPGMPGMHAYMPQGSPQQLPPHLQQFYVTQSAYPPSLPRY